MTPCTHKNHQVSASPSVSSFSAWRVTSACAVLSLSRPGDRPEPRQQPGLESQESGRSFGQLLERQALARRASDKAIEPLQAVNLHVPFVQAKRELIDVAVQVLFACRVIDTVYAALHHSPHALYAVRVDRAAPEDTRAMVDGAMLEQEPVKAAIASVLIGVDRGANFDVIEDRLLNGAKLVALNRERFCVAAPLAHPKNGDFPNGAPALFQLLIVVLVDFLSAYESFVYLNRAAKHFKIAATRLAQSVQEKPRRLLCDSDFFCKLHRRKPLASGHKQIHCIEPFVEWDFRALHNGASA